MEGENKYIPKEDSFSKKELEGFIKKYEINLSGCGNGMLPDNVSKLGATKEEIKMAQKIETACTDYKEKNGHSPAFLEDLE